MTGSPAHEHGSDGLTCSHPEVHSQTLWKENERLRLENAALREGLRATEQSLERIRSSAMAGLTDARAALDQGEQP